VAFRLMYSRCPLYCVPLPSGLGGAGSNNIWGCSALKINLILPEKFLSHGNSLIPKPDWRGKPSAARTCNRKQDWRSYEMQAGLYKSRLDYYFLESRLSDI